MHYLDWPGSEPTIVLLHPNRTNARVWDFVVEASGRQNRSVSAWILVERPPRLMPIA